MLLLSAHSRTNGAIICRNKGLDEKLNTRGLFVRKESGSTSRVYALKLS